MAERFLDVFEPFLKQGIVDAIVTPSGSCGGMVVQYYPVLFEEPGMEHNRQRAEALAEVTFELTEFLVDVLGVTDTGSEFKGKITFHSSCHTLREMEVAQQPRTLINNIEGAEFIEMQGHDECCGFGGLFAIKNAEISSAMGQTKTLHIAQSNADVVTLCDVSCMTHINGLLEKQGQTIRAVHIAQILNYHPAQDDTESTSKSSSESNASVAKARSEPIAEPVPKLTPEEAARLMQHGHSKEDSDGDERPRRWQDIR